MTSKNRNTGQKAQRVVLAALVASLLLLVHFYRPPQSGLWARVLFDTLHVPVFGLISIFLFVLFRNRSLAGRVTLAFVIAAGLGVLSELAQIATVRDASVRDLLSDVLGAAGFLAAAVVVTGQVQLNWLHRVIAAIVAIATLAWPLLPLAKVSAAYLERNSQVPVLVDFDSAWHNTFIYKQHATLDVIQPGDGKQSYARIQLGDGPWPGITFHDLWPDWREYTALELELALNQEAPFDINVRVHDREHLRNHGAYTDRYNTQIALRPGRHVYTIALDDIRSGPRDREMDLLRVEGIIIFGTKSDAGQSIDLYGIGLR
jgi:VanZ family protein